MPNFDGTGPRGQGPMTGRGMGTCNTPRQNAVQQGMGLGPRGMGRGFGMGRGIGRGMGRGFGRRYRNI